MTPIQHALLETIIYADLFDCALTFEEIYTKLHTASPNSKELVAFQLKQLLKNKLIRKTESFFTLSGREELAAMRQSKLRWCAQKLQLSCSYLSLLISCPWVLGIFISGSTGAKNPSVNDDIDLLIISKPNRLWLTRLWLVLVTEWYRLRRRPRKKKVNDKLCLNLFLEPSAFLLEPARQTLMSAYEIIQLLPLYDPYDLQSVIIAKNQWIKQFLAHTPFRTHFELDWVKQNTVLTWLNQLAFTLQTRYMKNKQTREDVQYNKAFFHPEPLHQQIQSKFYARKKQMGLV